MTDQHTVVIAGSGLAGTGAAVRMLRYAEAPLDILLVEKRPEYRSGGVAYSEESADWGHVFNIQAGRLSMFREDAWDFLHWLNHEADRSDWPEPWSSRETYRESDDAPRIAYQMYLHDRLHRAAAEAAPGVRLVELHGEVTDFVTHADTVTVTISDDDDGDTQETTRDIEAHHLTLATGFEEVDPDLPRGIARQCVRISEPECKRAPS